MRTRPVLILLSAVLLAPTAALASGAGAPGTCAPGAQQGCQEQPRGKKTPSPSASPERTLEEDLAFCTGQSSPAPAAGPEPAKGPKKTPEPAPSPEPTSTSVDVEPGSITVDPGYDPSSGPPSEAPSPGVSVDPSVTCSDPILP